MTVLFTAWGYEVTALEAVAVVVALIGVGLGIKGTRWTWPFYFLGSVLYAWLFIGYDLYASAAMQVVFMVAAVWGWFNWGVAGVRQPGRLSARQRLLLMVAVIAAWALLAPLLQAIGGAASWADAFMLVGSLAAQVLMVLEKVEAWPSWLIVNTVGTALYLSQGLYFTSIFYAILLGMAVVGWRSWQSRAATPAPAEMVSVA